MIVVLPSLKLATTQSVQHYLLLLYKKENRGVALRTKSVFYHPILLLPREETMVEEVVLTIILLAPLLLRNSR